MLRHAAVVALMRHRRHQRGLPITPAGARNARTACHARTAPVAAQQKRGTQHPTRGKRHRNPRRARLLRNHAFARDQRHIRRPHRGQKRRIKVAVFGHKPHRAFFNLGMIKGQEKRRGSLTCNAIAGLDLQDRLHLIGQIAPDPNRAQQPFRGNRQRIGAAIKARFGPRIGLARIDHNHPQTRLRHCQSQGGAIQPAAHDDDICIFFHGSNMGQISRLSMRPLAASVCENEG